MHLRDLEARLLKRPPHLPDGHEEQLQLVFVEPECFDRRHRTIIDNHAKALTAAAMRCSVVPVEFARKSSFKSEGGGKR